MQPFTTLLTKNTKPLRSTFLLLERTVMKCIINEKSNGQPCCRICSETWIVAQKHSTHHVRECKTSFHAQVWYKVFYCFYIIIYLQNLNGGANQNPRLNKGNNLTILRAHILASTSFQGIEASTDAHPPPKS